jgi:poly(3-hydroxybutyrate) depolymerase
MIVGFHLRRVGNIAMRLLVALLLACALGACAAASAVSSEAETAIRAGKTQFEFVDHAGDPSRPVTVWMYVPKNCDASCPLQFVMHGVKRNGEEYLDNWVGFADERQFIVITPEFTRKHFPQDDDYSLGRSTTEPNPQKWAFAVTEHLFDDLKKRFGFTASSYRLFGHSAGGQFVHRLHLFNPNHRANPIIAANPGWYTQFEWGLADEAYKFPYNTRGSRVDAARAKAALGKSFVLMLGDMDVDPTDPNLNRSKGANAQGAFRFARGQAFAANARKAAEVLGIAWQWKVLPVPGVAHDNAGMARAAIEMMYAGTNAGSGTGNTAEQVKQGKKAS